MSEDRLEADFLAYLTQALGRSSLGFAQPPTPILGGFDTRIFAFRLSAAPAELSGALVLRLLSSRHDPVRVLREKAFHDAALQAGYPVPKILLAETDTAPLGRAFLVMKRLPGRPLPENQIFNIGGALATIQARLHAIDPKEVFSSGESFSLDQHRKQLARQIEGGLDGLGATMQWLLERAPAEEPAEAICHGDFHPYNILTDKGRVTGVIDWPNALIGPAVFDVATTLTILRFTKPAEPSLALRIASLARGLLVRRYIATYKRLSGADLRHLDYYEALACMRGLVLDGQRRMTSGTPTAANPWNVRGLVKRVRELTGVAIST
jgi:aminoglycoside phosphotransferase (APT) family kinase protein